MLYISYISYLLHTTSTGSECPRAVYSNDGIACDAVRRCARYSCRGMSCCCGVRTAGAATSRGTGRFSMLSLLSAFFFTPNGFGIRTLLRTDLADDRSASSTRCLAAGPWRCNKSRDVPARCWHRFRASVQDSPSRGVEKVNRELAAAGAVAAVAD